jgi:hypothetical protein
LEEEFEEASNVELEEALADEFAEALEVEFEFEALAFDITDELVADGGA